MRRLSRVRLDRSDSGAACLFADHVDRRSFHKGPQIVLRDVHQARPGFLRRPADVGRNQAAGRLQQRIVSANRLHGNHVQARREDLAVGQRLGEILFHNQRPAAVVQNDYAVLHSGDGVAADDALGGGGQRTVQRNHVRLGEQLVQRHVLAEPAALLRLPAVVIGENTHAHGRGDARRGASDAAEADHAQGLARQFDLRRVPKAEIRAVFPAALVYGLTVMRHAVADLHQHRNGKLGHRVRSIGGNVAHRHVVVVRGGDIDDVVAGDQHADEPHRRTALKDRAAQGGLLV